MINSLKVLCVIPARGGSKGIPLKNLKKIGGIPIVEMAAKVATEVGYVDRIIVSTDNIDIANAAINGGAIAPFMRPEELSGDRVSDLEVLKHSLDEAERFDDCVYDLILMLQPTSPMRNAHHVADTIETLVNKKFDAVWTISKTDSKSHPLKQLIVKNNKLDYYDDAGKNIIARQQLKPVYHRNGIAYAITRDCILNKQSIMGDNTGYVICDGEHISIDTVFDLELVRYLSSNSK